VTDDPTQKHQRSKRAGYFPAVGYIGSSLMAAVVNDCRSLMFAVTISSRSSFISMPLNGALIR